MGSNTHRSAAVEIGPVRIGLEARLRGHLLRRYKRFLADVVTEDGRTLTVHCPNPGSMIGCDTPGAAIRCSTSDKPGRRYRHTLEMIRVGRAWVGLHASRANAIAARAFEANAVPGFSSIREIRREVSLGNSRLDFQLTEDSGTAYVEVKSVTMADGRLALFPDSVTERGRRHLETLMQLHRKGSRAALLFVVQRADCDRVSPADDIDPAYGAALRAAAREGVEILAIGARVTGRAITVERSLPVVL
ncbi:MAG: DNA/RNA nuclease SfsA [Myxococcota bacterium]